MKKFCIYIILLFVLVGCSITDDMGNTPTKKVEEYLNDYQTLDKKVLTKLNAVVEEEEMFNNEQKNSYRDVLKKHYQELDYTIKEETVNGDKATVEAEIEVTDYTNALKEAENYKNNNESEFLGDDDLFDQLKYNNYKLKMIKESKERVKYTIYFSLTKQNDEWELDKLTETEEEKILGIYEY